MVRTRFSLFALFVLSTLALMTAQSAHAQRYTVTDLGILPGKKSTSVYGNHSLNNAGMVVGHCNLGDLTVGLFGDYFTENVAFLWTPQAGIQPLPMLHGAANATGYTLNDRGQVLGLAGNSYLDVRAVLWEKGTVQALDPLPSDNSSFPQAINNHGQIAGVSGLFDGSDFPQIFPVLIRPVVWDHGQIHLLPMSGLLGGQANGINEKGQIVGELRTGDSFDIFHSVPVLWDNGSVKFLGTLGGDFGASVGINERGQVIGQAQTPDGAIHAFFWENGVLTDLGTRGGTWAALWALNNRGQAVGESTDVFEDDHAVIVEKGVMKDLNEMIPADSGWTLVFADGINERGQISGTGIHNGEVRGFLLTPKK